MIGNNNNIKRVGEVKKKIGLVRFPGTNCDRDLFHFVQMKDDQPEYLWHLDRFEGKQYEALIIPGGFSYGDYLRAGALSARSPVMESVREFAHQGGPVLGICNGFQVLTESGLLPGALVKNKSLRFQDGWAELEVVNKTNYWLQKEENTKKTFRLPIAHGEGRFYAPEDEMKKILDQDFVWFKYRQNPNGSLNDIAGLMNKTKNVAALMPHPERAIYDWMGSLDGCNFI